MKTTRLLSAVSAAALLGISSVALAQGTGSGAAGGGTGGAGAPAGNTMQRQDTAPPSGGAMQNNSGSTSGDRMSPSQAQSKDDLGKDSHKSNQAQGKEMGKDAQKSQAQGKEMGKDAQKSQAQERTPGASDSKSQMSQEGKEGAKSGSTVGAATSGGVNLTTEQRTTIRQEVLTSNAPRANNINFTVNVGTVVPSSVRVVEVPQTIIRIHPQWRGYRYFVYNDDIIIVEPRTLKIVAVLQV